MPYGVRSTRCVQDCSVGARKSCLDGHKYPRCEACIDAVQIVSSCTYEMDHQSTLQTLKLDPMPCASRSHKHKRSRWRLYSSQFPSVDHMVPYLSGEKCWIQALAQCLKFSHQELSDCRSYRHIDPSAARVLVGAYVLYGPRKACGDRTGAGVVFLPSTIHVVVEGCGEVIRHYSLV